MRRLHYLDSRTYAAGNVQFLLGSLPTKKRIQALRLVCDVVFTAGAAAAAITSEQLHRIIKNVQLGTKVNATGVMLHYLEWLQRGSEEYLPAGIPATNAGTFRRRIAVDIPFFDPSSGAPGDLAPNSEEHAPLSLNVTLSNGIELDTGGNTWNTLSSIAGTVRLYAVLDDASAQVNSKVRIDYVDAASQSALLPPGLYEWLFCYNEDGSGITSLEVTGLTVSADGVIFSDNLTLMDFVENWNREHATHGAVRAASATAPVAGGKLTHEPANTSAAAATVTTEFLPIISKAVGSQLSQSVPAEQGVKLQFSGSKTSFRLAYKMIEAHSEGSLIESFRKQGVAVQSARQMAPKTDSKQPLKAGRAWLAKYLPVRKIG